MRLFAAFAVIALVAACDKTPQPKQLYTCAMHPQYVSDKPGDCPICGMKLVPVRPTGTARRRVLFYRSPMDPQKTSPVPRKDEMGMDYVPVYTDEGGPDGGAAPAGFSTVSIDATQRRLIGLRTVKVARVPLAATLRTTGRVTFDESRQYKVTARVDGFVERLDADFTGKYVQKGDPLLSIYSPELYATEQEYLLARRAHTSLEQSGLPDAVAAARDRLRLFGVSEAEIARLEARGTAERAVRLYAPISGFVVAKNAVAGARVTAQDALFELVDLSRVWVLADVFEHDLPRVRVGQKARFTLGYWPGRAWQGKVGFVFPTVDDKTRTIKVRVELANPGGELKPEMFGDVTLGTDARTVLAIPDDAVIDSGTRKVAFLALGDGTLAPRTVELGLHADGQWEVLSGLAEGDPVAAGANFVLDSESRLRAAAPAPPLSLDGSAP
jgi:RND family efflux transporter MFP subunit